LRSNSGGEWLTRDLRKYSRQTTLRLILGGIALALVVGGGLVYLIYGPGGGGGFLLSCIGIGLFPVVLILVFLQVIDWIVKRANRE
jgi:hypothetical protein